MCLILPVQRTVSPGLCPDSVNAAMSGTYVRKMSEGKSVTSSKPSRPGKNVPLRVLLTWTLDGEHCGRGLTRTCAGDTCHRRRRGILGRVVLLLLL